jgi:hypothetical protein
MVLDVCISKEEGDPRVRKSRKGKGKQLLQVIQISEQFQGRNKPSKYMCLNIAPKQQGVNYICRILVSPSKL